jgi:hypothetical protein
MEEIDYSKLSPDEICEIRKYIHLVGETFACDELNIEHEKDLIRLRFIELAYIHAGLYPEATQYLPSFYSDVSRSVSVTRCIELISECAENEEFEQCLLIKQYMKKYYPTLC